MKDFDFIEFSNNLKKDFVQANRIISDLEHAQLYGMASDEDDVEYDFNNDKLTEIIQGLKLKIDFAYEYLGLNAMAKKLDTETNKYKTNLAKLDYIPYIDILYSPVISILTKHLNALTSHIKIEKDSEYENTSMSLLLEQILRGIPKLLFDRGVEPKNEAEVRTEVYKILIHVFPDTVREIPISKISKIYKPDIGIKRLKSAIEYKFVNSETDAKTAIGGIFEDINGYEGSEDWKTFYALIYMTDNFLTQDQVEAEFRLSKVPHHWKPMVVYGKGERKKK